MKTMNSFFKAYLAPEIEVENFTVEQGFAISNSTLPEYNEDDDVITIGQNKKNINNMKKIYLR